MAEQQPVPNINELPLEVLEHIFLHLPINERRNASLVCRSWNQLAFSRAYMRNVTLRITDYERPQQPIFEHLMNSSRVYRRVAIFFGPHACTDDEFQLVLNLMDRFGANIESLQCMSYFSVAQLRLLVDKIPNVEHLSAGLDTEESPEGEVAFPVLLRLRSFTSLANLLQSHAINIPAIMPNLRKLTANFLRRDPSGRSLQVLQLLAPRLRYVELHSAEYFFDISELHFPRAEEMKLSGKITETDESVQRTFFMRLNSTLRVMIFESKPKGFVLDIVTDRCPLLHKLRLKTKYLGTGSLLYLNRLKRLRFLDLKGCINADMLRGFLPMPSVETFHLHTYHTGDDQAIFLRFAQLLPNVTNMTVVLEARSTLFPGFLSLCRNFPRLRRLHLYDRTFRLYQGVIDAALAVQDMGQLEELSLNSLDIPIYSLVPSENLRRLILKYVYTMEDANLLAFVQLYPNLRYLEIRRCRPITAEGIRAVKQFLPNCVIYHDNGP